MKKRLLTALCASLLLAFASCSDSSSEEFNNANGDVTKKYITSVNTVGITAPEDFKNLTVTYDGNGKVTKVSNGIDSSVFTYSGPDLLSVSDTNEDISVYEFTGSPLNAYEIGEVLNYDSKGNPVKLRVFDKDYSGNNAEEFIMEIAYDDKPNPFFYTLEAAGIIKVLDHVNLNFSMTPQAGELVKLKALLPVNNPSKVVVKRVNGEVQHQVTASYVYDDNKYPTSATFTEKTGNMTNVYTSTYSYK